MAEDEQVIDPEEDEASALLPDVQASISITALEAQVVEDLD